jgi:predicted permease
LSVPWLDVKLALRMLLKYPGLTLVGTLALAFAMSVVAGYHAVSESFVHGDLGVPESDRIVAVWNVDLRTGRQAGQTVGDMLAWRALLSSLEDVGAFTTQERSLVGPGGEAGTVRSAQISPSAFHLLGVPPLVGRPLISDDEEPNAPPVAVLGFDLWRSVFSSDTAIVGQSIRLSGVQFSVVGIMPAGFRFPVNEQLWIPLTRPSASASEPGNGAGVSFSFGKLAPALSLERAEVELQALGRRLAADHPDTHAQLLPRMATYGSAPIEDELGSPADVRTARAVLVLILVLAAVSVATLVYARNAAREGEVTVRRALGASRGRIVLQMFVEALVLASLAGMVGVAIARGGIGYFNAALDSPYLGGGMPYWVGGRIGSSTLLLVVGLVLLAALLTGVMPALKLTRRPTRVGLQRVGIGGGGLLFGKVSSAVVVTQVTMSMVLLVAVSAIHRQFGSGPSLDDGIAREEYLAAGLELDLGASTEDQAVVPVQLDRVSDRWLELSRRVAREPGVLSVALGTYLPGEDHPPRSFEVEGGGPAVPSRSRVAWVDAEYFDAFDMPVRIGRTFDDGDLLAPNAEVAIVNAAFVRDLLLPGTPVGQRIRLASRGAAEDPGPWVEIVGVTSDVVVDLGTPAGVVPAAYFPLEAGTASVTVAVQLSGEPLDFAGRLRSIAAETDPRLMLTQVGTLDDLIGLPFLHLLGISLGFLVLSALVLSAAGVHALMSFSVTQRTREIGIRTALGATRQRVVREVLRRALLQVGAGTALGLVLGLLLTREILESQGLRPIAIIVVVTVITGLAACGNPIRRALSLEPTEAFREV